MQHTVYIVQDPNGKDISDARDFGKLKVLLTGHETIREAAVALRDKLKFFTDQDYLLMVGSAINMGLAAHCALAANSGKANFLVWNKESWSYKVESVNIYESDNRNDKPANSAASIKRRGC